MSSAFSSEFQLSPVSASNIGYTSSTGERSQGKGGDLRSKYDPTLTVVRQQDEWEGGCPARHAEGPGILYLAARLCPLALPHDAERTLLKQLVGRPACPRHVMMWSLDCSLGHRELPAAVLPGCTCACAGRSAARRSGAGAPPCRCGAAWRSECGDTRCPSRAGRSSNRVLCLDLVTSSALVNSAPLSVWIIRIGNGAALTKPGSPESALALCVNCAPAYISRYVQRVHSSLAVNW